MNKLSPRARRLVGWFEDRLGVDVLPRRYWSPVPERPLPDRLWESAAPLDGISFDLAPQLRLLDEIRPLMPAADDPLVHSSWFGGDDARTLYAMVQHIRPGRIVELGSGHSTRIMQRAIRDGGLATEHAAYDPFPGFTGAELNAFAISPTPATEVPMGVFEELGSGDVLFVDTTHTVKAGGDVNRIVLEILPRLAGGVWIQFHDIFLPYEYPREWLTEKRLYWAEQYLLQAFLMFNPEFEVRLATHALARAGQLGGRPSSFWLRRR